MFLQRKSELLTQEWNDQERWEYPRWWLDISAAVLQQSEQFLLSFFLVLFIFCQIKFTYLCLNGFLHLKPLFNFIKDTSIKIYKFHLKSKKWD